MTWFSVWLPLLLQLVVPVGLLTWLMSGRHTSRATWLALAVLVAAYIAAIGLAGLWVVLPWYLPIGYGSLWLLAVINRGRARAHDVAWPRTVLAMAITVILAALALVPAGIAVLALRGHQPPPESIDLTFPLRAGTYLVVNGGGSALINAHLGTLNGERFRAYRGQSYGLDLVRINGVGLRARGILPSDPAAYSIFGAAVTAPCAGRVVLAVDGLPDMPPPQTDREHMAGNHVIVDCGPVWVVLGHLQSGTVRVTAGDLLEVGRPLGRVGNSGNTGEPHLHIHAQRPGTIMVPLGGDPMPMRFAGRYLARNARVHTFE